MAAGSFNLSGFTVDQLKAALDKATQDYQAAPENSQQQNDLGYVIQTLQGTINSKMSAQTPVAAQGDPAIVATKINYDLPKLTLDPITKQLKPVEPLTTSYQYSTVGSTGLLDTVLDTTTSNTRNVILNATNQLLKGEIGPVKLSEILSQAGVIDTDIARVLPTDVATTVRNAATVGRESIKEYEAAQEAIKSGPPVGGSDVLKIQPSSGTNVQAPVAPISGTKTTTSTTIDYNEDPVIKAGLAVNLKSEEAILPPQRGVAELVIGNEGSGIPVGSKVSPVTIPLNLPESELFDYTPVQVNLGSSLQLQSSNELTITVQEPHITRPANAPEIQRVVDQNSPITLTPPVSDRQVVEPIQLKMSTTLSGSPVSITATPVEPVKITEVNSATVLPASQVEVQTANGSTKIMTREEVISAAGRGILTPAQAELALQELTSKKTAQATESLPVTATPALLTPTGTVQPPPTTEVKLGDGTTATMTQEQLAIVASTNQVTATAMSEAKVELATKQTLVDQANLEVSKKPVATATSSPTTLATDQTVPLVVNPGVSVELNGKIYTATTPAQVEELQRQGVLSPQEAISTRAILAQQEAVLVKQAQAQQIQSQAEPADQLAAAPAEIPTTGAAPDKIAGVQITFTPENDAALAGRQIEITTLEKATALRASGVIDDRQAQEIKQELERQSIAVQKQELLTIPLSPVAVATTPTNVAADNTIPTTVTGVRLELATSDAATPRSVTISDHAELANLLASKEITQKDYERVSAIIQQQTTKLESENLRSATEATTVPVAITTPQPALTADGTTSQTAVNVPVTLVDGTNVQVSTAAQVTALVNSNQITNEVATQTTTEISSQTNSAQVVAQTTEKAAANASTPVQSAVPAILTADASNTKTLDGTTVNLSNGSTTVVVDPAQVVNLKNLGQITRTEAEQATQVLSGQLVSDTTQIVVPASTIAVNTDTQYIIKPNDTLSELARSNNTTVAEIQALNPQIKDPDKIYAGKMLTLPTDNTRLTATASATEPVAHTNTTPIGVTSNASTTEIKSEEIAQPYIEPDEQQVSVSTVTQESNYLGGVASSVVRVGDTEKVLTRNEVVTAAGKGEITPDQANTALTAIRKQQESINATDASNASYNEMATELAQEEAYLNDADAVFPGYKNNYNTAQADISNALAAGESKTLVDFGNGQLKALNRKELGVAASRGQISRAAFYEGASDLSAKNELIMGRALDKVDDQATSGATASALQAKNFAEGTPSTTIQTSDGSVKTYTEDQVWEAVNKGEISGSAADAALDAISIQKGTLNAQEDAFWSNTDSASKAADIASQMDTLSIPNVTITDKNGYTKTYSPTELKDAVARGEVSKETATSASQDLARQQAVLDGAGTTTLTLNDGTVINNATKDDVMRYAGKGQITPSTAETALGEIRSDREKVANSRTESDLRAADDLNNENNLAQGKQKELYAQGVPSATVLTSDGDMQTMTEDEIWAAVDRGELSPTAANDALSVIGEKKAQLKAEDDADFASIDQAGQAVDKQNQLYNQGTGTATVTDSRGNTRAMTEDEIWAAVDRGELSPEAASLAIDKVRANNDTIKTIQAAREDITRNRIADQRKQNKSSAKSDDWRFRIRLAPNAGYMYKDLTPVTVLGQTERTSILAPLANTDGVVFPYTPTVSVSYNANYSSYDLTHSNYRGYFYQNSYVGATTISADFTAQDTVEAEYLMAVIHFFKACTKMFYGQDIQRGSPPPLVYLSGFGSYQFNEHAAVVQEFSYSLPNNVDYIKAYENSKLSTNNFANGMTMGASPEMSRLYSSGLRPGAATGVTQITSFSTGTESTYVPTKINLQITVLPIQTRLDQSKRFSLKDYASGVLLKGGFW